jgi:DNA-binding NtrC family response regulator
MTLLREGIVMAAPTRDGPVPEIVANFGDRPELGPQAAEVLWQALGALRATIRRAADTDLAVLIAGDGDAGPVGDGQEAVAAPDAPSEPGDAGGMLAEATARFQAEYIRRTIQQSQGNMSRAAERLGLNRSNLYRKMRQLGIGLPGATVCPQGW